MELLICGTPSIMVRRKEEEGREVEEEEGKRRG